MASRDIVIRFAIIFLAVIILDGFAMQSSAYGLLPIVTKTTKVVTSAVTTTTSTTTTAATSTITDVQNTTTAVTSDVQNTTSTTTAIASTTSAVQNTTSTTTAIASTTSAIQNTTNAVVATTSTIHNTTTTVIPLVSDIQNVTSTITVPDNTITSAIQDTAISTQNVTSTITDSQNEIVSTAIVPTIPDIQNTTAAVTTATSSIVEEIQNTTSNTLTYTVPILEDIQDTTTDLGISIIDENRTIIPDPITEDIDVTNILDGAISTEAPSILNSTAPSILNSTVPSILNSTVPSILNSTLNLDVTGLLDTTLNLEQLLLKPLKTTLKNTDTKIFELMNSDDPETQAAASGLDYYEGKVRLDIELASDDSSILEKIKTLADIELVRNNRIQVSIPVENIAILSSLSEIKMIQPPQVNIPNKDILVDGQLFEDSLFAQNTGGTEPVSMAVIDLAFDVTNEKIVDNIDESVSFRKVSGQTDPIKGNTGESTHGTAMAEIITGVASNVRLHLFTASNELEFMNAIDYAISKKVDIITISSTWINHDTNGKSIVTKKVSEAISAGITVIMPSGNYAENHWAGTFTDNDSDGWNEFAANDEGMSVSVDGPRILEKKPVLVYLRWADNTADFDVTLSDPDGNIVDYSSNMQDTSTNESVEYIHFIPKHTGTYYLGITCFSDCSATNLNMFSAYDKLEYFVPSGSVGVPTDADGAIVVGALENSVGKSYSSVGPTDNGLMVPNFFSPDGITTTSYGNKPFFGTSSSTAYVSGLIAILFSEHHNLQSQFVTQTLISDLPGFGGKLNMEQTTTVAQFNQTETVQTVIPVNTTQATNISPVNATQTTTNPDIETQQDLEPEDVPQDVIEETVVPQETVETPQDDTPETAPEPESQPDSQYSNQLAHELYEAGIISEQKDSLPIPHWYENVVSWWHDKKISNSEFKESVNYMLGKASN